jgi:N-acetylglucosaminyldiphosphoundecaprenol N-acetyl-beta-D-mannosaminyltransferase
MLAHGKRNLLGVLVDAIDYQTVVATIMSAACAKRPLAVSALAVHGVMTGWSDPAQRQLLNRFDVLAPDGQPVRWGLNLLYGTDLRSTVRGTDLTLRVLEAAAEEGLPVFFYGSTPEVLETLVSNVRNRFPRLLVAGAEASKFRTIADNERDAIVGRIRSSGARLVFVGLGCPRQEVFAYELQAHLSMPLIAVGAAFDYLAGALRQPPQCVQRVGLEWLWRLASEPRRLWRRYLLLNPLYATLLLSQAAHLWTPTIERGDEPVSRGLRA